MKKQVQTSELPIIFIPKFREYGIQYLDGGSAIQLIEYCPWCGKPLPESLRHQWFDAIEKLGLEPDDYNIPSEYISEEWYSRVAVRDAELPPISF